MKQKFASFLLTGKAATLPFYAPSVLADEMLDVMAEGKVCIAELPKDGIEVMNVCEGGVSAKITGCPGDAGTGPDVMNVVVTGLKPNDVVFLISADDKDGFPEWEAEFKLGATNVVFLKSLMTQQHIDLDDLIKEALPDYVVGGAKAEGGGCSISIPVDLTKTPNPTGFNLQAVIIRGDEVIFSEMDEIERDALGETCPPAPVPEAVDPGCETDMYGECVDDGGDDTGDDVYGGTGGDDTGSEAGGSDTGSGDAYGGTGGDDAGGSY
ncbi:hypothetical protein QUF54_00130 [Candidatus Marithioploca araucensis]|uniref:Uncharacterized protein n=1 Tax=Candidatus Marithioploca araucensis TaxID=70273 RepID=A0ABT7VQ05_9GAMM|nr:hypothetical protein [Candidatus Marithioploca araucensis]